MREKQKQCNKYGNVAQKCPDHGSHRSKLEIAVCAHYRANSKKYEILKAEDTIRLSKAQIVYVADFKIRDKEIGEIFWAEAKGYESERWPTIKKLWKAYGQGALVIWKGHYSRPFPDEVLMPSPTDWTYECSHCKALLHL